MRKSALFILASILCACHTPPTATFKNVRIRLSLAETGKVIKDQTIAGTFKAIGPDEAGVIDITGKDPETFTLDLNTTNNCKGVELITFKLGTAYTQYAAAKGHQLTINGDVKSDTLTARFATLKLKGEIMFLK